MDDRLQPLSVADLLRSPALQLSIIAGEAGLGRRVRWAHVSELEDPTPWLLGGELIMTTGMAVPRTAGRQRAYLERLDGAGVTALAVTEGLHRPVLRAAFVRAAEELGMPVLSVPLPVPFIAIAQEVAMAVQSDMHRRLTAQLHVFGALRTLATEDLSVSQLFARLERLSGYDLFVSTAAGRALLAGVPPPPVNLRHLLPPSFASAPAVPGGYVLPIPARGGPAGFLLAVERTGTVAAGLAVVQHIATVAALQVSIRRHERETRSREGAETLTEMLQGLLDPATAARRLIRMGFTEGVPVRLAALRAVGSAGAPDEESLARDLDTIDGPVLQARQGRDVMVLAPHDADLAGVLGGRDGMAAGLSRPLALGASPAASRREAQWALARACGQGGGVVEFGLAAAGRWVPEDPLVSKALVDSVLGSVIAYDEEHGAALVPSVRTWLEHDKRTAQAAAALHVHPNTLAYRVRRFEALSGRSLQATADMAEVWLAMHAALSNP